MPLALAVLLSWAGPAGESLHMDWAERLVGEIKQSENAYGSKPTVLEWRGVNGASETRNRTVCSTLFTRLIKQAYGYEADDIKRWFGSASPTAEQYHQAVKSGYRFKQIASLNQVKRGDVIAIDYQRARPGDPGAMRATTGHIMLVAGDPKLQHYGSSTLMRRYSLAVIDSSRTGHGPKDTRIQARGGWGAGGVGRGEIGLLVDRQGHIQAYSWSNLPRSRMIPQAEHSLLIGRFCGADCSAKS
jgi:hypothetical protein